MAHNEKDLKEWRERFQAVGRAQARYLYVLLVAGVFYWALHVQVMSARAATPAEQQLPAVGVAVNRDIVWGTAPIVLGCIILACLGTFHALRRASEELGAPARDDAVFESMDRSSTAIDFIVYAKSGWLSRLGLLSYPVFLSLVYVEAWCLWCSVFGTSVTFFGRGVSLVVGGGILILCFPRLFGLWLSKCKKAFTS
jgi:hypothetical protein